MEAYEGLMTRRSVRSFEATPLPREDVERIIAAGLQAPSSKHSQPWYLVADTTERKNLVAKAMEDHEDPSCWNPTHPTKGLLFGTKNTRLESARAIREAPLVVQIFSDYPFSGGIDLISAHSNDPEHRRQLVSYGIEIASLAACTQNLLLAAHSLGYGALWNMDPIGISARIKEIYGQPTRDYFTSVCVGIPRGPIPNKGRKQKFEILE